MGKYLIRFLSSILVIGLTGCASYQFTKRPVLDYKTITIARKPNNISINVIRFEDDREDKEKLGMQTGGLFLEGGDVVTETDISEWITGSLKAELKNAGYTIIAKGGKIKLSGIIERVRSNSTINYTGEIVIKLMLVKDNKVVLNKLYTGTSKDLCWTETDRGFANILEKALQNTLQQIVNDINNVLLK